MINMLVKCKTCENNFISTDIVVYEEIPRKKGGGFIRHNFGKETLCASCRNLAFAEDDYESLFSDSWVKPCENGKYVE